MSDAALVDDADTPDEQEEPTPCELPLVDAETEQQVPCCNTGTPHTRVQDGTLVSVCTYHAYDNDEYEKVVAG